MSFVSGFMKLLINSDDFNGLNFKIIEFNLGLLRIIDSKMKSILKNIFQ